MAKVTVIDHPLIQHKLTIMRDKQTSIAGFRRLLREIAHLMCYEVTRDLELEMIPIETPMALMDSPTIKGKKLVFASILRAGNGLLDGMLDLVPAARVAHIGIYRDHETLQPVEYYFKAPSNLEDRLIIVVDPMLATANSSIAAIDNLKKRGANNLRFLCLLAAPEGIEKFDGVVVSGLERLVKPDPRLYRVFCERYSVSPDMCVFIDDSEPNIVAARKFGMHGIHFADSKQLRKELIALGLPLKKK